MRLQTKLLLGLVGGGAALYGLRSLLRSRRAIGLAGRVVVVTGASSGLGLIVARQAARQGARLVIASRDAAALERAAEDLRHSGSPEVVVVPTDVSNRDESDALIARAIEVFGRIEVLVNVAGIMLVGPIETLDPGDYERVMATNFWGQVYPTLAAIPHMKRQGEGRIGNVVSVGGKVAVPHMLAYSASKFALAGFSEGLRAELVKDNIFLTAIYPGTIRTGGHRHAEVKGDREAEYSWFALSDTIPGLSTSAEACGEALWDAVKHGEPERVVGLNAKLATGFHDFFPEWNAEVMAVVAASLPQSGGEGAEPVPGAEIGGKVAEFVNRVIPAGTLPGTASHA